MPSSLYGQCKQNFVNGLSYFVTESIYCLASFSLVQYPTIAKSQCLLLGFYGVVHTIFRNLGCIVVGRDAKFCPSSSFLLRGCVWHYLHNGAV